MHQTGWNPPISQFVWVKPSSSKRLLDEIQFFFLNHRFHILHFLNSTGLFTKPTGRHYTKYRFSPDIVAHHQSWLVPHPRSWMFPTPKLAHKVKLNRCPGRFLSIIGCSPSVSKSNRLHVNDLRVIFCWIGIYSLNSSKAMGDFVEVTLNFSWLLLKLYGFTCNHIEYDV